jgi:hypothetical protein
MEAISPLEADALARAAHLLERYRYRFTSEAQLHAGIAQVLLSEGLAFEHEKRASATCRYDFWLPTSGIVIEAKIHGSYAQALRQVERYLQLADCTGVIIASSKAWAKTASREVLHGKPILLAQLRSKVF